MRAADLVVSSRRVVTPEGVRPAALRIRDGKLLSVESPPPTSAGDSNVEPVPGARLDFEDLVIMAGSVDSHVHINEPGRTDWEGFATATRAAAAGGVTTIVDMPLNCSPVTTTVPALRAKLRAAAGQCRVDYGCWGGLVPGSEDHLVPLLEAGVLGLKCFLVDSGIEEFPAVDASTLRPAMRLLAEHGATLLVHAELPGPMALAARSEGTAESRRYDAYLATRPPEAELEAVELLVRLCRETGCRVHVVHVSAADVIRPLRRAREEGLPFSAETCPHYLTFAAEEIPDGATEYRCAPPIRGRDNRELLWQALADGELAFVASDHSPCPARMKRRAEGDFLGAWGGIVSLELSLAAVWTGARRRGYGLEELAGWLCEGPARLAGLDARKGRLAPGMDADFVVWDPDAEFVVAADRMHCRQKLTPYEGRKLEGSVRATFVRGTPVYETGEFVGGPIGLPLTGPVGATR